MLIGLVVSSSLAAGSLMGLAGRIYNGVPAPTNPTCAQFMVSMDQISGDRWGGLIMSIAKGS